MEWLTQNWIWMMVLVGGGVFTLDELEMAPDASRAGEK